MVREYNFDGLVGPTHHYAGLSAGNLASTQHGGALGDPRRAALEGLAKMHLLSCLGVGQAVLPPQPRPDVEALRRLGFGGSDVQVLDSAFLRAPELLAACSSASAMWAANAATVAPSSDTADGRVHFSVANLCSMFHRSLEATQTHTTLSTIFADTARFAVHARLPPGQHFSDEGAANHSRLGANGSAGLHVFGWGRNALGATVAAPTRFPARQTLEASAAVARLNQLREHAVLLWQQDAGGIDQGVFHSDVLAVGNENFFLLHDAAFCEPARLDEELKRRLQGGLCVRRVSEAELSVSDAVGSYLFNSQIVTLPNGEMTIVAPQEVQQYPHAEQLLLKLVSEQNPITSVTHVDINASMKNGGGPACLRLRVALSEAEVGCVRGRVFLDESLYLELSHWIARHYRDRLSLEDFRDANLLYEGQVALQELTQILRLGSIYPFQGA